jgi:hypothetical protein
MTPEQIAAKGAFVRVLREYADRANDNFSQKVAVPEHVLRDAATCIEDQRAHIDALKPPEGARFVLMSEELALGLGANRIEWGEPDEHGWYSPTLYKEHR